MSVLTERESGLCMSEPTIKVRATARSRKNPEVSSEASMMRSLTFRGSLRATVQPMVRTDA